MSTATLHTSSAETEHATAPAPKPMLPALTGVRTLLALTIVLFHFTPAGLRWPAHPWVSLYPIIDVGYVFVGFFFLISGFVLAYNYGDRPGPLNVADFWVARLGRLYPVYLLALLVSVPVLLVEWHVRDRLSFWTGAIATPLLMQGLFPREATFWTTVGWTLSCEVMLYLLFPLLLRLRLPRRTRTLLLCLLGFWLLGITPHTVYLLTDPDHIMRSTGHLVDRYSDGFWIDMLKYSPQSYLCTFLAGLTLGRMHGSLTLPERGRAAIGAAGFLGVLLVVYLPFVRAPYILVHGGLLTPLFAAVIVGLAGNNWLARILSVRPLVAVGASTYCLYLLHFNVFMLLHKYGVPQRLGVARLDPWISYVFIVLLALAARRWVEHPCQVAIAGWWQQRRASRT